MIPLLFRSEQSLFSESPESGLARNGAGGWRGEHRELKGPYVRNARPPEKGNKPAQAPELL